MRKEIKINDIHIGEKIREVLECQERTAQWFADKLCCDRTNVYDIFKRRSLSTEQLEKISVVLDFDFFALYNPESAHSEEYVLMLETLNRYYKKRLNTFSKLFAESIDAIKISMLQDFKESVDTLLTDEMEDALESVRAMKDAKHIDRGRLDYICESYSLLSSVLKQSLEVLDIKMSMLDDAASFEQEQCDAESEPCMDTAPIENLVEKVSTEV